MSGLAQAPEVSVATAQRRVLTVLSLAQVMSGFGLAAGITVGALLVTDLWGSTAAAGLPAVLFTGGAAAASLAIARLSDRRGRRAGLAAGYLGGATGAVAIVVFSTLGWVVPLLLAFLLYGAGSAANLQARFAGADLAPAARRGSAMAVVLMATTVGAVLGPLTAGATGSLATGWGLAALLGPFVLAAVAYAAGAAVLWVFLTPDPLLAARAHAHASVASSPRTDAHAPDTDVADPLWRRRAGWGIVVMVAGQAVMVAVMTMTPVHMTHHGHAVSSIGLVIALHVAAMYAPSPVAGALVDRWGPWPVAALAGAVLGAAGAVAGLADPAGVAGTAVGLVLLGVGWSLAMVAGSTIVTAAAPVVVRAAVQGRGDALIAIAGASGAGASGVAMSAAGFPVLALASGALAVAVLAAALGSARRVRAGTMSAS